MDDDQRVIDEMIGRIGTDGIFDLMVSNVMDELGFQEWEAITLICGDKFRPEQPGTAGGE